MRIKGWEIASAKDSARSQISVEKVIPPLKSPVRDAILEAGQPKFNLSPRDVR